VVSGAIFDLDGTLIDSRACTGAALAGAVRSVLGEGVSEPRFDLSLPLDAMVRAALPDRPEPDYQALSDAFRREYDSSAWKLAVSFPGAQECLSQLTAAGIRVFVVTNKRESAARRVLRGLELHASIEAVFGQPESGPGIAKQVLGQRCLSEVGLLPQDVVAVGDSDQDAEMARAINVAFIAVVGRDGPLSDDAIRHGSIHELWELPDLVGVAKGRFA
jgi:phosphoglycolate phosphatase-like HAD superfamily hydrolase